MIINSFVLFIVYYFLKYSKLSYKYSFKPRTNLFNSKRISQIIDSSEDFEQENTNGVWWKLVNFLMLITGRKPHIFFKTLCDYLTKDNEINERIQKKHMKDILKNYLTQIKFFMLFVS